MTTADYFSALEPEGFPSEEIKKAISSEVDVLRNTGQVAELFTTRFFQVLGSLFPEEPTLPPPPRPAP